MTPSCPGLSHGCPVGFCWTRRMAWILVGLERFAAFETRTGAQAMRHQNSVFHSLMKHVPDKVVGELVEKYGADDLARKLTTKRHLIALLYGQFSGATGLREIVTGLESHEAKLYHWGAAQVKRSTMSEANTQRPWQVFAELFAAMLKQSQPGLRRGSRDAVRLIDSTSLRLCALSEEWARFSTGVCGAKVHIVYDPHAD